MTVKETMPPGFTLVWEKPFLVIGNESPEKVRERAKSVVAWTRDLLLKDFFPKAPEQMEDVWVAEPARVGRFGAHEGARGAHRPDAARPAASSFAK
jgi:hypothetical protein